MNFTAEKIPYKQTGSFSRLVLDYLDDANSLKDFYNYHPDAEGLRKATADREIFPVNRKLLVEVITEQYKTLEVSEKLRGNIKSLLSENTFTVCTAHQPNLFIYRAALFHVQNFAHHKACRYFKRKIC